ncbi:MAG: hypothetical protein ABIS38_07075, partial [Sphingomicrobium sp.]
MAKTVTRTSKSGGGAKKPKPARNPAKAPSTAVARRGSDDSSMGDVFIKLLQSPLVADLLAVAATAALAALAEHGFSNSGTGGKRAGRA